MMNSGSNPIFSNKMNENYIQYTDAMPMTVSGTINKTFLCFLIIAMTFGLVYYQYLQGNHGLVSLLMMAGLIVGFILALIICFTRKALGVLVPLYACCEGAVLGGISSFIEAQYPGIVVQAVMGTIGTLGVMLALFKMNVIRATQRFRSVIFIATVTIALFYVITFIMSFFLHMQVPFYTSAPIGIAFSLIVVAVAALNLIIDFENIETWSNSGMQKSFEWFGAFGLTVTLVWLYIEILNLLSKLRNR